ncbi:peptide-methionine (S)-S-oxide reductase MsrA [Nitrosomonas sp. ANs5]|uniref:peptide-methionine (S)-S-oxide reductase MsrA n=1 Tax=Nitrosomonas sp. ANs5 TaxID=3423941 RepID=UPI003D3348CF
MMAMLNHLLRITSLLFLGVLVGCQPLEREASVGASNYQEDTPEQSDWAVAIFAGGCFWCTEADFDKVPGVKATLSGYIGGHVVNPTYEQVSSGKTGHIEAVKVYYDPAETNYARLLAAFWPTIDPLTADGQFCDKGPQYRSAIFVQDDIQRQQAETSRAALDQSGRFEQAVVTEILPVTDFYPAEAYHQDYYLKNPIRYKFYRSRCGRDQRLTELWGER